MSSKANQPRIFQTAMRTVVRFLEREKVPYFLLGGLAVGVLGEPRFTYDIDLDIHIPKKDIGGLLKRASKGFRVNVAKASKNVQEFGTFRMNYKDVQIDCILASTALEEEALHRRSRHQFFGCTVYFPSPEDLLLLKIIPGRPKDLIDAESIIVRHKSKLDRKYLERWAQKLCDEAEEYRIRRILQELLGK